MPEDSISAPAIATPRTRRRRKWLRRTLWTLAALAFLVLALGGSGLLWLHRAMVASLPVIDGKIQLAGLSAPVSVRRDSHGVPHIEAANLDDLLLAQGYVTAQDRLWQMDALRRNASGELAEILGPSLVDHDLAQRVFQFRNVSARIYRSLPEMERHRYEQYAKGVNLFIDQNQGHLPAEFRLLHYRPRQWTGSDSVLILTSMVNTLDSHWYSKLMRQRISLHLHDAKLEAELYPNGSWRDQPPTAAVADMTQPHPAPTLEDEDTDQTQTRLNHPHDVNSGGVPQISNLRPGSEELGVPPVSILRPGNTQRPDTGSSAEDIQALRHTLGLPACADCTSGSNEWVISGKHTASGKAMLSNDMHLDLSVPNIWYMAELKAPGLHVTGVSLPGTPLIIAGHNDHVAWGFTALYADVQDLYIEKLDGKGNYAGPNGEWLPLGHASELIHVRLGQDVKVDVQLTAHGPLITPVLHHETRPISLHWTFYDPALAGIPLYQLNTAANLQQFSAALGAWCWPTLNVVYADDAGHIAYHAIGKVPLRPAGLVGTPIQDAQHEWQGYIPFDEMPFSVDPPSGLLATANSRVTPNDTKYPLTLEWADPYRAERIYLDLRGRDMLTRDDMLQVQTDIYSELDQELAHRLAYAIDHAAGTDARLKQAADLMRSWDGRVTTDSAAASILYRTRQAFWPLILEPKLGSDANAYQWSESNFAEEEIIMHGSVAPTPRPNDSAPVSTWLPPGYKDWDALLTEAVRRGLDSGKAPSDLSKWNFGSWHVVDLEHPIYQMLPLAKDWSGTGELPLSGDTVTIKQSGRAFGPSQRFTMDWSAPDASTENIVLGQSGNPMSPFFRDQWPVWFSGKTFPMPFSPAAVASQTTHTLQLVP